MLGPSARAVADADRNAGIADRAETGGRFARELLDDLDAPHLRAELGEQRRLIAKASADLEHPVAGAHAELALQGIHNAAAVVVDHEGGEVRALVGNVDFSDAQHGGQIPGFATPRSPGSLLKPFLYALALDRGLALPEHLVRDVPARWGTYAPENYDGRYSGLVRLEDALSRSLNVPFVRLLSEVGVEPFLGLLDQLGARHVDPRPGHYGLSAAVGGVEVTPLEAAGLFASLAEDGRYRPPRLLADAPPAGPARPVLTPGAAWLTRRALARRDRPDFPSRARVAAVPRRVHWKTGTSYGHRDAWAAGSGPRHTAVVWLGNFDWTPSAALVGSDAVGPLLFDLLDGVADRRHLPPPDPPPPDLVEVEVCRTSGHLPTEACPERRTTLAPERSVATARCPFHVRLDVDEETGLALAPRCRAGRRHTARSFLVWPAGVRRWLRDRLHDAPAPPPWAPGCAPPEPDRPPAIVSPPAGHALLLIPGVPPERQEVPLEADTAGAGEVSWFVDGEWLGTVDPADRLWWRPSPGEHHLRVVDEAGQSSARTLVVRGRR